MSPVSRTCQHARYRHFARQLDDFAQDLHCILANTVFQKAISKRPDAPAHPGYPKSKAKAAIPIHACSRTSKALYAYPKQLINCVLFRVPDEDIIPDRHSDDLKYSTLNCFSLAVPSPRHPAYPQLIVPVHRRRQETWLAQSTLPRELDRPQALSRLIPFPV